MAHETGGPVSETGVTSRASTQSSTGLTREDMTVLFVDDEENILRSLKRTLMDEAYRIETAPSGAAGLELLPTLSNVAVIVSDQRMPGMNGVEFLARSREIVQDAIRIVLTGYADVTAAVDAINKGGAYRYLAKPWSDDDLVLTVREAVDLYLLKRENERLNGVVREQNRQLQEWNDTLERKVEAQAGEIRAKNVELEGLNEKLRQNFDESIACFARLSEIRSADEQDHSRRVTLLAIGMARELRLNIFDLASIRVAATLHDIGKIGIPETVLARDYKDMTESEQKLYRMHPVRGQAAIDSIEDLRKAGLLIRHHHEYFNGSGFPDGLSATNIPIGARIIGLADFIDRTMSKLAGEDAVRAAMSRVRSESGRMFDASLLEPAQKTAHLVYKTAEPTGQPVTVPVSVDRLKEGMIVSRDVRSGTGLLLLRRGTELSAAHIVSLRRYHAIDPSAESVFIYLKEPR